MIDPIPNYRAFVESVLTGPLSWIVPALAAENIKPLMNFTDNWNVIERFYSTFVTPFNPQVVICGINPGKDGAGRTGIPFMDFKSLSQCLPGLVKSEKKERSAEFFNSVVEHFGLREFYMHFYVTNISCIGFEDANGRNLNYPRIANPHIKKVLYSNFQQEMNSVRPHSIVALGDDVVATLNELKANNLLNNDIEIISLYHPNYAAFKSKAVAERAKYIRVLSELVSIA
jgi:hypothetical protein